MPNLEEAIRERAYHRPFQDRAAWVKFDEDKPLAKQEAMMRR
ncbi:hypothetical protein [Bradyrhizobium valentinum]|nr:hypothetical protein [Bradyrhizobium valentinum]